VLTTNAMYEAFYAEYSTGKAFLHSHSYTGNPLACSAALATLAIFRDEPLLEHPHVAEVRQTGMIAAVELVADKATRRPFPAQDRRGLRVYLHGLQHEALLRPLGNVVYFMPPYVTSEAELDHLVAVATAGVARAVAD